MERRGAYIFLTELEMQDAGVRSNPMHVDEAIHIADTLKSEADMLLAQTAARQNELYIPDSDTDEYTRLIHLPAIRKSILAFNIEQAYDSVHKRKRDK